MKKLPLVIGLASLICLAGCGQSQTVPTTTTTTTATTPAGKILPKDITIKNFKFSPATIEIAMGESIQRINEDGAPHVILADDNTFQSETLSQGSSFTFTFTQAGEYDYHCSIHPTMKGKILVK